MAGYGWLKSFLHINTEVTVRKAAGVSLDRARGLNKETVKQYFKLVESALQEHCLFDKPGHLFNMDETGLQLNNRTEHLIAQKGSKNVMSCAPFDFSV